MDKTKLKILRASRDLFANHAFKAVTTRMIAKKAQVNEVTVFRLFGSKGALIDAVYKHFYVKPSFGFFDTEDMDLETLLKKVAGFIHVFFEKNVILIKIEVRNHDSSSRKRSILKFPEPMLNMLSMAFANHKGHQTFYARADAIGFITNVQGLCMNLYVFNTIQDEMGIGELINNIVDKYK